MLLKNVVSWNSIALVCIQNDNFNDAFYYFTATPKKNTTLYNVMILGLVRFKHANEACNWCKLFEELVSLSIVSYTELVNGYAGMEGGIRCTREFFQAMPLQEHWSWTVMVNGIVENGLWEEV